MKIALSEGLHPVEFSVQLKPSRLAGWAKDFELSWQGPSFERRDMVESDYLHNPARITELSKSIKPLQKRNKPPTVEYSGQPLFLDDAEAARLYKVRDLGSKSK